MKEKLLLCVCIYMCVCVCVQNFQIKSMKFAVSLQQQRTLVQMRINLMVVDNSGAKQVMCIQALKGRRGARLGDTITVSVKEAQPRGKVKKGDAVYGIVVCAAM